MSPVGHIQWKGKLAKLQVPVDLYHERIRSFTYKLASIPLVPFFVPFYFLSTFPRQQKMNKELARNDLWPNTKSFLYKGFGVVGA